MADELRFERRGAVAWVTLNRPEVRNALTPDMRNRLIDVVGEVGADPEQRCLVITGAGEGFCTGADIRGTSKRQGSGERTAGAARDVIVNGVQRLFRALWNLEVPTVAAVNGTAAGFGCHLAWMCDLVIASENAKFIEAFTRRGIVPDGGGAYLLPRLVGLQRAKEILFFGDDVPAHEAERIGLVNRVVPRADVTLVAREWAQRLAAGPTVALTLTKRLVNRSL